MSLDDPALWVPTTEPTPTGARPKPHRHQWVFTVGCVAHGLVHSCCVRCDAIRDESKSRTGRTNRTRGQRIQRERIQGLGGRNLAGNNPNLDGLGRMFAYESKSGGAFSARIWRWLTGIPKRGNETGVLIVTEAPGPGRRARSYVVVEYDEWKALHGESET